MPLHLVALSAAAVSILPLVYLVVRASERGWAGIEATLGRPSTVSLVIRSVELAVQVTVVSVVIGVGLAWLVARTDLPFRRVVRVVVALPLALPSYVAAFGWINQHPGLAGHRGAFLVLTTISYPYVYLPVLAALSRCDPALEDAARTLGHRRWSVFRRVLVPQLTPATTGGALLVGLYVLSDFGAVSTMRYSVLTQAVYRSYRASFDRTPAAVLGCVIAALTLLVVGLEAWSRRRGSQRKASVPRAQPTTRLGRWRWPALALPGAVVAVSLGVPLQGIQIWLGRGDAEIDPGELIAAAVNSLHVGALGALAVLMLAAPVAYVAARRPSWSSNVAISASYVGHALPGVVVGLGIVFFGIRVATEWYQRLPLLVFAYLVLFLSLGIGAIQGVVTQIPTALEDVAQTLGRSRFGAWRSVTLRLMAPGLAAAATLVFLTVMKELPATLLLRPTGWDTLATRMWGHLGSQTYSKAAPYAVAIVVIAAVPTAALAIVGSGRRDRGAPA